MLKRPKPIADQVEELLLQSIREGAFLPGGRLPPEHELAQQLGVSRTSIRTALTALEARRLVIRRQGDGTYLNRRIMQINTRLNEEWDFKYMIQDTGRSAFIRTLEVQVRLSSPDEAEALELPPGGEVLSIRRLFLADQQPVIHSRNLIPADLLLHPGPYDVERPIRDILYAVCEQDIFYSTTDLSARLPDPDVAELLQLEGCTPVLHFTDLFYNDRERPVVLGLNEFNDQALRLRVTRR